MTDSYIGRLLANRYQLVELIGKGAMGRVYRAQDLLLGGVPVAVKFLAQALLNKNDARSLCHRGYDLRSFRAEEHPYCAGDGLRGGG
ncbi:hypothetical protein [Neosynechococcus sphagnicola]|uniref:hypothetical protein n=1 Tax=Neosynechococcus sphagnicola TaxID=1501145 RepID=UPI000B0D6E28